MENLRGLQQHSRRDQHRHTCHARQTGTPRSIKHRARDNHRRPRGNEQGAAASLSGPLSGKIVDKDTLLVIRGCEAGNDQRMLDQLAILFAGEVGKITVLAPKFIQVYEQAKEFFDENFEFFLPDPGGRALSRHWIMPDGDQERPRQRQQRPEPHPHRKTCA